MRSLGAPTGRGRRARRGENASVRQAKDGYRTEPAERTRRTCPGPQNTYSVHSLGTTAPGPAVTVPSRLPCRRPSDRISSVAWTTWSLDLRTVIPLSSFSRVLLLPTSLCLQLALPFHCIQHWRDRCMFRPVTKLTIDSKDSDAIRSQANGTVNFQSLDVKYLGPKALSVFISATETGMVIILFARFFVRRRERLAIHFLVYFVTSVALYVAEHLLHCECIF